MKKIIFISIVMSLVAAAAIAQNPKTLPPLIPRSDFDIPEGSNQYPYTSGTITKSGYTYKYKNALGFEGEGTSMILDLYNAANSYIDVEWAYKDGTPMSWAKYAGEDRTPEYTNRSQDFYQTISMIEGLFTAGQKATFKGEVLSIRFLFDPSTGKVVDVYFTFKRNGPLANIPVETYRSIELAIKQNLTLTATAEGRRLNYIASGCTLRF